MPSRNEIVEALVRVLEEHKIRIPNIVSISTEYETYSYSEFVIAMEDSDEIEALCDTELEVTTSGNRSITVNIDEDYNFSIPIIGTERSY